MSCQKNLRPDFDWKLLEIESGDIENAERRTLLLMLLEMDLIRSFEKTLLGLKEENLVHGPVHASVGQEAIAVGAMHAIRPTDLIGGTHRAHHQFLAKAITYHTPPDYNPLTDRLTSRMQEAVNRLLAEIMGLAPGYCGGRGGSMHLYDATIGVLGTNAIVGGGIPIATGAAWAQKYKNSNVTVVSFFGDGAVNQGAFHEALNLAGLWKLPIVYIIENNLYAVATRLEESTSVEHLSLRAASYGIKARIVDGMNPLAVKIAVEEASRNLSRDKTPFLIEATTYRFFHHAGNIPGSKFGYRGKGEEEEWESLDPLKTFPRKLKECGLLSEEEDRYLKETAERSVQKAVEYCTEKDGKAGKLCVKASLWPKEESLVEGLPGDGNEFEGMEFVEEEGVTLDKKAKYVEAITEVTGHWLEKDPNVFVIGEEVASFGGGAYQATRGLPRKYPGRVVNAPISEAGFSGLACGAALCGLRPIVEIMFPDFVLVSADQIFNQIGKLRYIYGGKVKIPLVMRTRIAIGCGYGGQHSMDPVAMFALFPGWKVVAPTTPFDY
ncbi:MAG: thiamine pyrophosphate-dependent enzyme, partial [Candidatus Omnitrophota bacterium]